MAAKTSFSGCLEPHRKNAPLEPGQARSSKTGTSTTPTKRNVEFEQKTLDLNEPVILRAYSQDDGGSFFHSPLVVTYAVPLWAERSFVPEAFGTDDGFRFPCDNLSMKNLVIVPFEPVWAIVGFWIYYCSIVGVPETPETVNP
eukprot:1397911-Amphidinium_carterae.1